MTRDRASNESTSDGSKKRSVIFDLFSNHAEDSRELIGVAYWSDQVTTPNKIKGVKFIPDTDIPNSFTVESVTSKTYSQGIGSVMGMAGKITLVLKTPNDREVKVTLSDFGATFDDRSLEAIRTVTIQSIVKVEGEEDEEAWQTAEE